MLEIHSFIRWKFVAEPLLGTSEHVPSWKRLWLGSLLIEAQSASGESRSGTPWLKGPELFPYQISQLHPLLRAQGLSSL